MEKPPQSEKEKVPIGSIDFHKNKGQLILSYVLRLIGLLIFGVLFIFIATLFHPELPLEKESFIGISIKDVSPVISILLIILDVIFVLYLHEMIHASVFYLNKGQSPQIGIRGLVIYARAPGHYVKRNVMILNGLAPFTVISILGAVLMSVLPANALPWVLIPTIINAAAAGGDFMIMGWMLRHSSSTVYKDEGDIITAFSTQ